MPHAQLARDVLCEIRRDSHQVEREEQVPGMYGGPFLERNAGDLTTDARSKIDRLLRLDRLLEQRLARLEEEARKSVWSKLF